jgi:uncharacterized membrane protein YccC
MLATSDQGFLRLQMAIRGTTSVFLTTVAALIAANFGGFSPIDCASGITLSMMAPFLMREPTRRQRQRTLLMLILPAICAAVLTTLLHGHEVAGDSAFLLLVFGCFLLAPRSPRVVGLGLVAVITTYVGLYLELPIATLPVQVASQIVAVPIIALACFVLFPMDPAATLRRSIDAVQARTAQVIRMARALEGPTAPQAVARLRRAALRLNQAALAVDDQLVLFEHGPAGAVRSLLVDVEYWTAVLIGALESERPHRRLGQRLLLHARRIQRGGTYATQPDQFEPGSMLAALVALGHAVHALGIAAREPTRLRQAQPGASAVTGALAWRLATRVTLASGLAMAGGMALSPQRWFWAVITVYVVFLNVRSRGDTIYKGVQRMAGTVLGILSGLMIATAFSGDRTVETVALLLSIFGMYYFAMSSYTACIFFVTVMLGLIYGMLGAPLETVLALRLEETLIGAAAGMFVAAVVFPNPTSDQVRRSGQAVLRQLAVVVRLCATALGGAAAASPSVAMREVDRLMADLRLALAPMVAGRSLLRRSSIERPVSALLDCVHWARLLAAQTQAHAGTAGTPKSDALEHLARQLETLGEGRIPELLAPADDVSPDCPLGTTVANLNRSVTTLAERVALGAYDTYLVDA